VRWGQPHIGGTQVEHIGGMMWAGESVDTVADEYGHTRPEVLTACWWLGVHGTRRWRQRWQVWARQVEADLARGDYTALPGPPAGRPPADTACDGMSDDGLRCHRVAGHDGWHVHDGRAGQTAWPNTARTARQS